MMPTANEVREKMRCDLSTKSYDYVIAEAVIEVAAQLVELNQHLRKGHVNVETRSSWTGGPR